MCNKMYENVKSLDYTKKSLQSDSDPATMEVVTRTNAVKSPTNSPETTKLVYTVKEVAQMLAISQRAAYNLCNSTTEFRVLRAGEASASRRTVSMHGSTGQLDKEANLWHISRNAAASYSVRYTYQDEHGKSCDKWESFPTKEEAVKRQKQIEHELATGNFLIPSTVTVAEFLMDWLPKQCSKHKWAPKTIPIQSGPYPEPHHPLYRGRCRCRSCGLTTSKPCTTP